MGVSPNYVFEDRKLANWTAAQEKSVSLDYPFDLQAESLDQYVARTYLQFLWLPESIMPLHLLVPSLQRVNAPSTSDASVHPMHAFLEPLLLTTRTANAKYHTELPQILADNGGAGEMEETMMWYSLTHEKAPEDLPADAEGPWSDEKWREKYFERMEKREVQIQILLYMFKLSLSGPPPPEPPRKKKRRSRKQEEPILKTEDHLESFMDKLSMWQLSVALDPTRPVVLRKDERDWVQKFAEGIVERQFKTTLPEACSLLRSKVFPSSPFSDDDSNTLPSRQPSPEPLIQARKSLSRAPSASRLPSPALSASSRTTAVSKTSARALVRSRSRSLSVSLAQEQEERERANATQPKKRILNREISMSRVFKPKTKPKPDVKTNKTKSEALLLDKSKGKVKDCGVTLVEETPAKSRILPSVQSQGTIAFGKPTFDFSMKPLDLLGDGKKGSGVKTRLMSVEEEDGDEEWMMDGSPDIVLLNPGLSQGRRASVSSKVDSDEEVELAPATPSKPSKRKRKRK
ncbi:hypothetical protein NLJ89_g8759 [Agrocybe chaxingu]|uniref:DNA replication regulator Sld3 C-terminal domain-containing protein n=1 Tax=Agrocybe chaxingu TaxID=84603 RepID=A0A9W8JU99_9AGAR|nr:hypothetical protein NLJ89_g8759 [Agrocybe chaxingu]